MEKSPSDGQFSQLPEKIAASHHPLLQNAMLVTDRIRKLFVLLFVLMFFAYLFGPLIIMGVTAFNSSAFPRVAPWECFTVEWFSKLANDTRLLTGVKNSVFIGLGVVCLAVPLGLAGALMLTQVKERVRPWYYTVVISPILVPGVVLGISTLLFWDRVGVMFGADRSSIFYNGYFLTIIGQSTFIAAYTMLVFISRLQRFETVQEEAALDLGASHWQSFRKILLPFLRPAIGSAAVLAFLASFENYNTTVFTAISTSTITTVLASKVRYGIDPSISALAVVIVFLTVVGAAVFEVFKRRELKREEQALKIATSQSTGNFTQRSWFMEPALIMIFLIVVAGVATTIMAGTVGVEECKVAVKEEKQRVTQERIKALREKNKARRQQEAQQSNQTAEPQQKTERTGTENFNSIFSSDNLAPESDSEEKTEEVEPEQRTGTENFNSIFSTDNLAPADDNKAPVEQKSESKSEPDEPETRTGTENFNSIFNTDNLAPKN